MMINKMNPWSNYGSRDYTPFRAPVIKNLEPFYTPPVMKTQPYIPPPVTNPAGFVGSSTPYQSANPIADFFCAPTHTTPWPHNAGYKG